MDLKKILIDVKNWEDFKLAKSKFFNHNQEILKLRQQIKESSTAEVKSQLGKKINLILQKAKVLFEEKRQEIVAHLISEKIANEKIDVEQKDDLIGNVHPLNKIANRIREWLLSNSYLEEKVADLETEDINFQKLNMPSDHPARDMQESFYIDKNNLLRTHNTGGSIKTLLRYQPFPVASFTIGNVYRRDAEDETHSHQFMQCDLVCVGDYSIGNLTWTLENLLSYVFEEKIKIRLRPSFFPFTEPSCEVDILYRKQWLEVLGAGMLHPKVLKACGYDVNKIRGFAAGIGIDRLAMIKYNIQDIRMFYLNDLRFNRQFKGTK